MTPEFYAKLVGLAAAAIATSVLLALAHTCDWERIFGRKVGPPWSYVAGVLCLALPFSILMVFWGDWWPLAAAVTGVMGGGLPVLYGYRIRREVRKKEREVVLSGFLDDERQINELLRQKLLETEREKAALVAKLCASEAGHAAKDPN